MSHSGHHSLLDHCASNFTRLPFSVLPSRKSFPQLPKITLKSKCNHNLLLSVLWWLPISYSFFTDQVPTYFIWQHILPLTVGFQPSHCIHCDFSHLWAFHHLSLLNCYSHNPESLPWPHIQSPYSEFLVQGGTFPGIAPSYHPVVTCLHVFLFYWVGSFFYTHRLAPFLPH